MKKVISLIFIFLSFFCLHLHAQNQNAVEEKNVILDEASSLFYEKNYQKAAKKVNELLEYYASQDEDVPENVALMSETVYSEWLGQLFIDKNIDGYKLLREMLKTHPFTVSEMIYKRLTQMHNLERQELVNKKEAASKKLSSKEWLQYDEMLKVIDNKQNDLIASLRGYKTRAEITQEQTLLEEIKRQYAMQRLALILTVICSIGLIVLICFLVLNSRRRRKTEDKFEIMMNVVSLMNRKEGGISEEEIKRNSQHNTPKIKQTDLINLEKACNELGAKIDDLTCRKNNSRKVGELVYKMAKSVGVSDDLALLYFCAAMVYDSGFLAIDKAVFESEHLTVKQRYWIREHVKKARDYFDFVPEDMLPLFLDAAEFHHENLDGSGYIDGIHDKEIPLIARLIHTAESYTSLVNRRNYHAIMDKESAIEELKRRPGVYDPKTIEVLEEIV